MMGTGGRNNNDMDSSTRNGAGGNGRFAFGSVAALRTELSVLIVLPLLYFGWLGRHGDWHPSSSDLGVYGMLITACLAAFGVEYRLGKDAIKKDNNVN